jgi:N-acyl-D-aspartate/D-glutamate deacylase
VPAERIGLADRGVVRVGAYADFAVFDPSTIRAAATFETRNRLAVGMRRVITNGILAIEDAHWTGDRGGRVLRA